MKRDWSNPEYRAWQPEDNVRSNVLSCGSYKGLDARGHGPHPKFLCAFFQSGS